MFRGTLLLLLMSLLAGCAVDPRNQAGNSQASLVTVDWLGFFFPKPKIDPSKVPDGYIGNLKTRSRNPTPEEQQGGYAWQTR